MRTHVVILCAALAVVGCKKKGTGGGGGAWFVGEHGLMANVGEDGLRGDDYGLGSSETLNSIACRYAGEAWVAGNSGTLLYTADGGQTWSAQEVETIANLRSVATQDHGPVFIVGDGVFMTTTDTGATWRMLGDGTTSFRSVAAAHGADTVLALADDGGLWSYDGETLARTRTLDGARAIAVSDDGGFVMTAGQGLMRSLDGGATWVQLAVDPALRFHDVRITEAGGAVAVGDGGTIANVDANGRVTLDHVPGSASLRTIYVPDEGYEGAAGFAAGDDGQTYISYDAGWTWVAGPKLAGAVLGVDEIGTAHR